MKTITRRQRYSQKLRKPTLRNLYGRVGLSIRDIAKMFGMGYSQVRDRIIYHNIEKCGVGG